MFEFVHEQPGIRKNGVTAKQVRSHVTRQQHRQKRELNKRAIALLHSTTSTPTTPEPVTKVNCKSQYPGSLLPTLLSQSSDETLRDASIETSTNIEEISRRPLPSSVGCSDPDEASKESTPDAWLCPSNGLLRAFSQGQMSYRTTLLQDTDNVIGTSLNILHLDLSSVMSLYKSIGRAQSKDFRSQWGLKGTLPEPKFYGFVHTDPTLLSMAVLLGVRNHLDLSGRRLEGPDLVGVVNLESHVVGRVNSALPDGVSAISSQMLATVALCAAYELKHGDPKRFPIHMQGLVHMINLRGGLSAVGSVDPYIRQWLLWLDVNISKLAGTRPYLQLQHGEEGDAVVRPQPNTEVFRARHETDCREGGRSISR